MQIILERTPCNICAPLLWLLLGLSPGIAREERLRISGPGHQSVVGQINDFGMHCALQCCIPQDLSMQRARSDNLNFPQSVLDDSTTPSRDSVSGAICVLSWLQTAVGKARISRNPPSGWVHRNGVLDVECPDRLHLPAHWTNGQNGQTRPASHFGK
jgi:hypothetical protein